MKIAIIGSGYVGKALASSSLRAGHSVTISSKSAERAAEAAKSVGARSAASSVEAVKPPTS